MNGFDFKPAGNPYRMLTPEVLAQAAAAAFRPPQPVMMSGLNLQPPLPPVQQPAPGFSLRDGMAFLSAALDKLGKPNSSGTIINAAPQGMPTFAAGGLANALANNPYTRVVLDWPGQGPSDTPFSTF